jgi:hypothetical protein
VGDAETATATWKHCGTKQRAAADLGFDAQFTEHAPFVDRPAVEYPNQARFDPKKYLRALVEEIDGDGSAFSRTPP